MLYNNAFEAACTAVLYIQLAWKEGRVDVNEKRSRFRRYFRIVV